MGRFLITWDDRNNYLTSSKAAVCTLLMTSAILDSRFWIADFQSRFAIVDFSATGERHTNCFQIEPMRLPTSWSGTSKFRFNGLFGWLSGGDIGIDLGTANTLVYVKDKGIVLREPSVVAVQSGTNKVLAVGNEAKRMLGRTPSNIVALRPLKDGVIADFEVTEAMLRHFISKAQNRRVRARPRVLIAVPSGITEVEKRAVRESAIHAGAREVYLIEEPMAAAIGVGLPIQDPAGNMIIDIGGGTTEVAMISLSGIVFSSSVRVAGDELDEAIVQYMKRAYNVLIGERTAEEIKIKIGSAYPTGKETTMEVKGRDLVAGRPKTLTITSQEVREALQEPISTIVESVRITLERCPPELSADLVDRGLVLAGGGALLRGLDKLLSRETDLPVHVAEDPLSAVAEGTGKCLNELKFLRPVASTEPARAAGRNSWGKFDESSLGIERAAMIFAEARLRS